MLSKEPDIDIHIGIINSHLSSKKLHETIKQMMENKGPNDDVSNVVGIVKEYAFNNVVANTDIETVEEFDADMKKEYQQIISEELLKRIYLFLPHKFRESIVEYHSHGLTTSDAITYLIQNNLALFRLSQNDAIGIKKMRRYLIPRLSYLKPGHPLWPEDKYGDLWRHARYYKKCVTTDLPFTTANEQVGVLINHVARIQSAMENSEFSVKELHVLTNALTKTLQTIQKLTINEQQMMDFSTDQLLVFLERITNTLGPSGKIPEGSDVRLLVDALEKLVLALKIPPEQKAITG